LIFGFVWSLDFGIWDLPGGIATSPVVGTGNDGRIGGQAVSWCLAFLPSAVGEFFLNKQAGYPGTGIRLPIAACGKTG